MTDQIMLAAHVVMCLYVFSSVFIRAKWLDHRAQTSIRLVFFVLGCVALLGVAWPVARPWVPDLWSLLLLAVVCLVQRTTAEKWRDGVPYQFLRCAYPAESRKREVDPREVASP